MDTVRFFSENIEFTIPFPQKTIQWIQQTVSAESHELSSLNFIFCDDAYLHSINKQYLQHDDFTDVITFSYAENPHRIEGDIFISIDRVKENAAAFQTSFNDELHRVMIHGVLHLLGYNDKSESERQIMRKKENSYLSLYV